MNQTVEETATKILDIASDICIGVINKLSDKYKVERSQISLVGGGGGATALLPFTAKKMGLSYQIAEYAEVISSIGVALAMVRDVVERVVPNPTAEDIAELRLEATDMVVKSGASPDSVEIQIEIDSQSQKVRAIATGSTEIKTMDLSKKIDDSEALELAAKSLRVPEEDVRKIAQNNYFYVFGYENGNAMEIRVIDKKGFIKIQRADGNAVVTNIAGVRTSADKLWESMSVYKSDIKLSPDIYLCIGARVIDYEGLLDIHQLHMVMESELAIRSSQDEVIVIGAKNNL